MVEIIDKAVSDFCLRGLETHRFALIECPRELKAALVLNCGSTRPPPRNSPAARRGSTRTDEDEQSERALASQVVEVPDRDSNVLQRLQTTLKRFTTHAAP